MQARCYPDRRRLDSANSCPWRWQLKFIRNDFALPMKKNLCGVVFASVEDEEYEGMAHLWVRDAETAYWFSLSRAVESDAIEVMVSDQLNYRDEVSVTLSATGITARLSDSAAGALDGHSEYSIEFYPGSQDIVSIKKALEVIFRGKPGLLLDTSM